MQLFRDVKYVTSGVLASLILSAVRSIVVLRILGPALMGAWKSALLVDTFSEFARMGVSKAVGIRVAVLAGKGDEREADRVVAAASAYLLWLGLILGTGIFSLSFVVSNTDLRVALRCVAFFVALQQIGNLLRDRAAARHLFVVRAKENLLQSIVDLAAAVVLCKLFGLAGLGAATVLALFATVLYLQQQQHIRFHLHLDFSRIKDLIRVGVPFSLTEAAFELTRRLDVLLIALLLGSTSVGYYGISLLIMDFVSILAQKGVSQVLSPHLLHEFGRTASFSEVAVFYEMPAKLFCYVLPPVLGIGSLLVGDFVRLVLPQYVPGIPAAQITVWAVFFVALHSSISSFFVAAGMIPVILRFFALIIPLGAAGQFVVLKAGLDLPGAAWMTVGTLGVAVLGEMYLARKSCGYGLSEIVMFLISLLLPLAASILLTTLVDGISQGLAVPAVLADCIKVLIFLLLYAPVLATYEIKFSMLRLVRQTM
jgi:O-antigen/teichoic acid export membrane protein